MSITTRFRHIGKELLCHSPYTLAGAVFGVLFMLLFKNAGPGISKVMFQTFHPLHVVLSAMVTSALFSLHSSKKNFLTILLIGYVGSIGVATLSDCVIPFYGEEILGVAIPSHAEIHKVPGAAETLPAGHEANDGHDHDHGATGGLHLGFIEEWYLVNPAALLGVLIAWRLPRTRMPHMFHILVSTWASAAHVLMNTHATITPAILAGMFIVLFLAVWLPCCLSDIVLPLLFVKGDINTTCRCTCSHPHDQEHQHASA